MFLRLLLPWVLRAAAAEPTSQPEIQNVGAAAVQDVATASSHERRRLSEKDSDRPRFHLVTFVNKPDRKAVYLQVTAEAHDIVVGILGMGVEASWPDGLGVKINKMFDYVHKHVADDDVVVFFDAFDGLVFGMEDEIVTKFLDLERRSGKSLIFNSERGCFPEGAHCQEYPEQAHKQWRYLNSGLIIGRGWAWKKMLVHEVPNFIIAGDQTWYHEHYVAHKEDIHLDTECYLLCAVFGVDPKKDGVELRDDRIYSALTGNSPPLVHFVSVAHWRRWEQGQATTILHEVFKKLYPAESKMLLDQWDLRLQIGVTHDIVFHRGNSPWFWRFQRMLLCFRCNLHLLRADECKYFRGPFCEYCFWFTILWLLLIAACSATCYAYKVGLWHRVVKKSLGKVTPEIIGKER